ncbi:Abi family protein [Kocuria sp.]|uniref:Abi family protein n=1 Tax=Kocuria sp. TaxID=1871328 RepID=UPI0026E0432E|nr:Abi family protein [Kocuria sp.]MDO5618858.1 Abi family protein [Kocuria sp.]
MTLYGPVRESMTRLLSAPRLETYKTASSGKLDHALALYKWNTDISGAFLESQHYFEVALRNTVVEAVRRRWCPQVDDHWYDENLVPWDGRSRQEIQRAKSRLAVKGKSETDGQMTAEVMFGFWVRLFDTGYSSTLWKEALKSAMVPNTQRKKFHASLERLQRLRNRAAHHEPLIHLDCRAEYEALLSASLRVHADLGWWIDAQSRVPELLGKRLA